MISKMKYIVISAFVIVILAILGFVANNAINANKDYIGGNVLNLPWSVSEADAEPSLVAPWVSNSFIMHLLYRNLLIPDHTLIDNYKPDLASKIEILEDGFLYKVHFNTGNKWSNGIDITLDDVIFSIETVGTIARTNPYYKSNFSKIESMEVDGNVLNIRMAEKSAMMLPMLSQVAILPKHMLQDIPAEDFHTHEFWIKPVTSGMFKVNHYERNKHFQLVHNEHYSGTKPKIDEVILHFVTNNDSKLDYYFTNNISEMMSFRAMRSYEEYIISMLFFRYLAFNIAGEPGKNDDTMRDIRIRQAICMSLDRVKLLHDVYLDTGNIVNSAGVINAFGPYNYNPTKARQLLEEANYDFNRPLVFGYYNQDVTTKNYLNMAAQQLEEIGFKVELLLLSNADALFNERKYDFYLKGFGATRAYEWFSEYVSTNTFFTTLFDHKGEFDELFLEISAESDTTKHNQLLNELASMENTYLYKFPLHTLNQSVYINTDRVKVPKNFVHGNNFYNFDYNFINWEIKKQ